MKPQPDEMKCREAIFGFYNCFLVRPGRARGKRLINPLSLGSFRAVGLQGWPQPITCFQSTPAPSLTRTTSTSSFTTSIYFPISSSSSCPGCHFQPQHPSRFLDYSRLIYINHCSSSVCARTIQVWLHLPNI